MSLDLATVVSRVNASGLFLSVTDAAGMTDAMDQPATNLCPAAFVFVSKESAEPNVLFPGHRQRITSRVTIAFVIVAQAAFEDRRADMESIRTTMRGYMMGWTPPGTDQPFDYVGSEPTLDGRGFLWVSMWFDTSYSVVATPTLPSP